MKCPLCEARKGKRFCPAKQRQICAQCCGEKRVIEIPCPADCPYLSSGQEYHRWKDYQAQLGALEDPRERIRMVETLVHLGPFLDALEKGVVQYAGELQSLRDQHVEEAVSFLLETYRTESKGIIYEHSSTNPLVQALVRKLRDVTEQYRSGQEPDSPSLGPEEVVRCLKFVRLNVRHYAGGRGTDYLDFVRRNHPELAGRQDPSGGIISL